MDIFSLSNVRMIMCASVDGWREEDLEVRLSEEMKDESEISYTIDNEELSLEEVQEVVKNGKVVSLHVNGYDEDGFFLIPKNISNHEIYKQILKESGNPEDGEEIFNIELSLFEVLCNKKSSLYHGKPNPKDVESLLEFTGKTLQEMLTSSTEPERELAESYLKSTKH